MDRMTLMDASFLYSEDGRTHNDVGNVLVFEGPCITREEVMQSVADRIALVPRFRQRIKHMPFGAGLPVWIDDTAFDMGRHVRYHPAPAHPDPIGAAVSRVMSVPMDLSIPLWQMHLITGLDDDRWVLIVRMHHAMVDGVSTTEILQLLLSPNPEGDPPVIDTWHPRPEPPDAMLQARLYEDFVKELMAAWQSFMSGSANLSVPQLPQTFDPSPLMQPGIPISPLAINGPLEPGRQFGMVSLPLATFKGIRQVLGGTVNDLILAACGFGYSSAIEEYLHEPVQGGPCVSWCRSLCARRRARTATR